MFVSYLEEQVEKQEYRDQQGVVIVADCDHASIDIEREVLRDVASEVRWLTCKTEDELIAQCGDGVGLLIQYAPMTRRVFERLPRCRIVARYGVGVDTIDAAAAADRGIVVSNVPDYGTNEVSDHALAMMLCLTRKVPQANALVKRGQWDFRLMRPIYRHQTQTIGIIGLGRIGRALAHKTHALGMKVIGCDPYADPASLPDYVTLAALETVLRQSDVVSVHCPLTEETRNLLDEPRLRLMKPSAYLVNTARGHIVDEAALDRLLAEKKLAGAAMDVLAVEPGPVGHPLFRHENFYCTPHMAWHSEESARELKRKAAEEVRRVLRGEAPIYQVNKF
ncbi:MAG: C-terminal binding protein [Candidatus Accumulibacter sp.]|jgi:D-3-phosphoglycerate dehydrogenase|nr:C-terminal binding protein [Accumulibacter sp.]